MLLIINIVWLTLLFIVTIFLLVKWNAIKKQNTISSYELKDVRENEELKTVLYSIGEAVITTDQSGSIVRMNEVAEKLIGVKEAEVKGKKADQIFSIVNEDEDVKFEDPIKKVLLNKTKIELSNSALLKRNDGTVIPVSDSASPIINDTGNLKGVVLILKDETENRRKKKLLQENERKFFTVFHSSPEGIILTTLDGKYVDVNLKFLEITGYTRDEILGKTTSELNFWKDPDVRKKFIASILEGNSKQSVEFEFVLKSGEIKQGYLSSELIEIGNDTMLLSIMQDITERKEIEFQIRKSEQLFRALVENSPDFIARYDREFRRVYVNPAIQKLFANYPVDIIGKTPAERSPLYAPQVYIDHLKQVIETGNESMVEIPFKTAEGQMHWGQMRFVPEFDPDGKVATVLAIGRDIHVIKESEQKFKMLASNFPDFVIRFNQALQYSYVNPAVEKAFNITSADFMNKGLQEFPLFFKPEQNNALISLVSRNFIDGKSQDSEITGETSIGERIFEIRLIPEKDATENIVSTLCILRDITDRKQTEHNLQIMNTALANINQGVFLLDMNNRIRYVNEAVSKSLGYTKEELLNLKLPDIDPGFDLEPRYEYLKMAKANKLPKIETSHRRKNGEIFPVEISSTYFNYDKEELILSLAEDITERKIVEQELMERQAHSNELLQLSKKLELASSYDDILDAAFISVNKIIGYNNLWVYLLDENIEHCKILVAKGSVSKMILNFSNVSTLTIKGDKMLEEIVSNNEIVIVEDARIDKRTNKEIVSLLENRTIVNVPIVFLDKHLGSVGTGTFGDEGIKVPTKTQKEFLMALASHLAVSLDRIHLQLKRKEAEDRIRKLSAGIEQSPASVVITDLQGNVEYVNKRFTEVTGYSFDEIKGKHTRLLKSGETSKDEYKNLWETISQKKEWRGEFHNKRKNGELYWEIASISPILNENGEITNFIAVKEDITHIKNMTNDLITARNKAEEMNKVKSYFYAQMSHELRTPFIGIFGFADLLRERLSESEEKEMAEAIYKSSKRLMDTLNKILDITKLEFETLEPIFSNINLSKLLLSIKDLFAVAAQKQNNYINLKVDPEVIFINTDEKLLTEIIENLVSNAIKYTINGLIEINVNIKTTHQKNAVIIKVADNGIGIPADKLDVIWDDFRQVSEGFNRTFEGTGLGLSITKKYVGLIGGNISVESKIDEGTTFTLQLPYQEMTTEENHPAESSTKSEKGKNHLHKTAKILYIEDESITALFVKRVLSNKCIIDTSENATSALEKVNNNYYDAILLDINLKKGIDGLKLMQLIREIPFYKTIPIAAITAFATSADRIEFLNKGFSHYLSKPFDSSDLNRLIDNMLGLKQA